MNKKHKNIKYILKCFNYFFFIVLGVYFYWLLFMHGMLYANVIKKGHSFRTETTVYCNFVMYDYLHLWIDKEADHSAHEIVVSFHQWHFVMLERNQTVGLFLLCLLNIHSLRINKFQILIIFFLQNLSRS